MNNIKEKINKMEKDNNLLPFPRYSTEIINDLKMRNKMVTKKADFNNVPVSYCKTCLSLLIKKLKNPEVSYCITCSNSDIGEVHVHEWDRLYEERYGKNFLKGE